MTVNKKDFKSLKELLVKNNVSKQDIDNLKSIIDDDDTDRENQKFGKKVSNWIGKMFSRAIDGSWKPTSEDAGKLLAEAVASYYGFNK